MRVLLAIDLFDDANNGTTVSARRFAHALLERGHEVRAATVRADALGLDVPDDGVGRYPLDPLGIAGFNGIIARQGMRLARPDDAVLRDALGWADVVHVMSPFWLGRRTTLLADRLGVPATGAFHVQPENITSSFRLGHVGPLNDALYALFRPMFNRFGHVHCPSRFIAGELRDHGYDAELHVVSNGVDPSFRPRVRAHRDDPGAPFVVMMTGRLSVEKRQDLLIEAVRRSRYADRIQLVLAGRGPLEKKLAHQGASLALPPQIGFYPQDELQDLLAASDLYVHAADAEIEAIGCLEAIATGLVPVISDSHHSATGQFALDERSLFRAGDAKALARAIDGWLDDDAERARMGRVYAESARAYGLDASVTQLEAMLRQAVVDHHAALVEGRAPAGGDDTEPWPDDEDAAYEH
ncbi:MAG: glycosyltransferase [Promicromonosporaceae bacterium]|nr:glycosyltransferase [Promicromonosporaceae bacterium]